MSRSFHPHAWLVWGGAGLAVALLTRNPLYLLPTWMAVVWVGLARGFLPGPSGLLRLILPLLGLTTFWNLLTVHVGETVLLTLPSWLPLIGGPVTLEAGLWGLVNGGVLALLLSLFLVLNRAVSPHELTRLVPSFLREAALVASVALTFVPQTARALREIREAQAVRGHRMRKVRDLLPLLLPLLISGLERAVQLAEALEARGYGGGDRPSAGERASLAAGLAGMLAGWLTTLLWWEGSRMGYLLAAGGAALVGWTLWRVGRRDRRTRYRSFRWTPADRAVAAAAAVPLVICVTLAVIRPAALAYVPYPRVSLPSFDPLVGVGLALLAAPALLTPPARRPDLPVSLPTRRPATPRKPIPIRFDRVTFAYPGAPDPVLRDVSLEIPPGTFTLVSGASGVGKSTLLRCINGLVPHASGGRFGGRVWVGGIDTRTVGPGGLARWVGFVFQDPEAQFVTERVEEEVAFALENAGVPPDRMRARVEGVMDRLGLAPLRDRPLHTLSGGEMQRVAIAAALVLEPSVLVLDEPTSQLDPAGAQEVLDLLARLREDLGITVVLAEHRLERVLPYADLMVYLPGPGRPLLVGPPREVLRDVPLVPPVVALGQALGWEPLPVTVEEARPFAERLTPVPSPEPRTPNIELRTPNPEPLLAVEGLRFSYDGAEVLRGVDLGVGAGERVVLMGPNGAGKTTLLRCIVGLLRPQRGSIRLAGEEITGGDPATICQQVGYLPQDPGALLFAESVREELRLTLANHGLQGRPPIPPEVLLERLGLATIADAYPRDLSVGERARVAIGAVTVTRPRVLLLDEPTRGLDYGAKEDLLRLLDQWRADGAGVLIVTHDVELAAQAADRVVVLEGGRVVRDGPPRQVLTEGGPSPQVARLFPSTGWLTPEDVLRNIPDRRAGEGSTPFRRR